MEAVLLSDRSPTSLKRATPSDHYEPHISLSPIPTSTSANLFPSTSSSLSNSFSRQASPAASTTSSLTSMSATPPPPTFGFDGTAQSTENGQGQGQPPTKKRKLTDAEREQKNIEKAQKAKEREEKLAKREEEKQLKEEEKRQKDEERRQRNEAKEEEKRLKDEERRQKNEVKEEKKREKELEKIKKQEEEDKRLKKQPRLTSFFEKPRTPAKSTGESGDLEPTINSPSKGPSSGLTMAPLSEYRQTFLPFYPPSNSICAPAKPCTWDESAVKYMEHVLESTLFEQEVEENIEPRNLQDALGNPPVSRQRSQRPPPVSQIVQLISGSESLSHNSDKQLSSENPLTTLAKIPMHYLLFAEDVRPPYVGTYSKRLPLKVFRNPFARLRQDTDYDYDSEAEWEEPEPGDEDLDSDGDSEGASVDEDDEMDEFLDDTDADGLPTRRKLLLKTVDLEPISSGLCFENSLGDSRNENGELKEMRRYKLGLLLDSVDLPIDPFSASYWHSEPPAEEPRSHPTANAMDSMLRQPLQARPNAMLNNSLNVLQGKQAKPKSEKPNKELRLLSGPELDTFKAFVEGTYHNKVTLLGLLKERFPKIAKAILADTLNTYAARVGRTEAEKKWVVLNSPP